MIQPKKPEAVSSSQSSIVLYFSVLFYLLSSASPSVVCPVNNDLACAVETVGIFTEAILALAFTSVVPSTAGSSSNNREPISNDLMLDQSRDIATARVYGFASSNTSRFEIHDQSNI